MVGRWQQGQVVPLPPHQQPSGQHSLFGALDTYLRANKVKFQVGGGVDVGAGRAGVGGWGRGPAGREQPYVGASTWMF